MHSVFALDTLIIQKDFKTADIRTFGWLFMEEKHELNFEKIRNLPDATFEPLEKTGISFAANKKVYWVKFYLKNESPEAQKLMLEIQNPRLNQLQVFFENEKKITDSLKLCGDNFPFHQRIIKHRYFLFPIEVLPGEVKTIYVFADKYAENIRLLMAISCQTHFHEMDQKRTVLWSLYLGFLIFFCVLMLIALVIFKKRLLLYFFLYSSFVALNQFSWLGYGFQYIWSDYPFFHNLCGNLFIILSSLSFLALTRVYLQTANYFKLIDLLIKYIQYGLGCFLIYLFFYRQFSETVGFHIVNFGHFFQLAYLLVILIVPIISYLKRGEKDHLIFLGGFLFLFFGMVIHVMESIDLVDSNVVSRNLILFGFGIDLLTLMYIIGRQIQKTLLQNLQYTNEINALKLEAASALLEGQQQERQRLSLDLHDGISLRLAILKMRLSQILSTPSKIQQQGEGEKLIHEIGAISEQVRNFTHALAPFDLNQQSLADAIEDLIYTIEQVNAGLDIQLNMENFNEKKLTYIQKYTLFQTIQELLHNALKHAGATRLIVHLNTTSIKVNLLIQDNGKGFDVKEKKKGIGLKNSTLRATFLNGDFAMNSNKNGSEFSFSFPVASLP